MEGEGDGGCGPPTPPVSVLALIASAVRNEDTQGGLDSGSSVTQGKLSVVVSSGNENECVYCTSLTPALV